MEMFKSWDNLLSTLFMKYARTIIRDTNESLDFDGAAAACRLLVLLSRNKVVTFSTSENRMKLNVEEMHGLCKYQNVEKQN